MESLNKQDELLSQLQAFKLHPTWLLCVKNIEQWKSQVLAEILKNKDCEKQKGEFEAYGRLLNLPDKIIQDLTQESNEPNLDAYARSNPPAQ